MLIKQPQKADSAAKYIKGSGDSPDGLEPVAMLSEEEGGMASLRAMANL